MGSLMKVIQFLAQKFCAIWHTIFLRKLYFLRGFRFFEWMFQCWLCFNALHDVMLYLIFNIFYFRIYRLSYNWKTTLNSAMTSSRAKSIEHPVPGTELARGPCDNIAIPLAYIVLMHNTYWCEFFTYLLRFNTKL